MLRERRPDRAIETNVEFWAAVILDFAQVPPQMMPAMFTAARTAGWSAHILEQKQESKLVRPSAQYIGPAPRTPAEVEGWAEISHSEGAACPEATFSAGGHERGFHDTGERVPGGRGGGRDECDRAVRRIDSDSTAPTAHSTAPPYQAAS